MYLPILVQRQLQQKKPGLELQPVKTKERTTLEDILVTTCITLFENYNESLEQFHADLVELASRADYGECEDEWVRDMFTTHMNIVPYFSHASV